MTKSLIETGPIRLDDTVVNALVDALVKQVEQHVTRRLVKAPSSPIGEMRLAEKRISITDVRGVKRDLFIKVKSQMSRSPRLVLGGKYEPKKHKIVVYLNGVIPAEQAINVLRGASETTFEGAIRGTLVHELTHAHDYLKMRGYKSPARPDAKTPQEQRQAYIDYLNQPDEVRAFMQQMVREVLHNAKTLAAYKSFDTQRDRLKVLLRASEIYQEIGKFLTPANRKKMLQAVYRAIAEYLKTGKKPRLPRAPLLYRPTKAAKSAKPVRVTKRISSRFADLELESRA
jgi:hypothetical protein